MTRPTFAAARARFLDYLEREGWRLSRGLKVPHATSPDGQLRLWFKPQAVYYSWGRHHELGNARSLWADIRDESPEEVVRSATRHFHPGYERDRWSRRHAAVRIPPRARARTSRRVRELVREGYSPRYAAREAYRGRDRISVREERSLPASAFALPARRALPLVDPAHVRNAAARLAQMKKRGTVTPREYASARARIDRALARFPPSARDRRSSNAKHPSTMTASEINRELDRLAERRSHLNDEFIAAGRGRETASETWKLNDPLARRWREIAERHGDLRNEIELRYGPGAPSRLPARGFGPRRDQRRRRDADSPPSTRRMGPAEDEVRRMERLLAREGFTHPRDVAVAYARRGVTPQELAFRIRMGDIRRDRPAPRNAVSCDSCVHERRRPRRPATRIRRSR